MQPEKADVICAIEDDKDVLQLIRHSCESAGYCFVCETDGAQGLRLVKELKPDLVLLDLMLPGMSGFEICAALRQEPSTRRIPVVIISACGEEEDVARGLDVGACDYIVKPFRRLELLARIRRHLSAHKNYLAWRARYEWMERQQREQQAQMRQASRLAEIGAMAAGLQHELANITSGLAMGLDVMQRVSPEISKIAQQPAANLSREERQTLATLETVTAVMREDLLRLLDLSKTAMNFSRPEAASAERGTALADVGVAVKRALRLARAKSRNLIAFEVNISPGLYIPMSQTALEQIFMNLLSNAVDAVLERRRGERGHEGKIIIWAQSEGCMLTMGVADNGCGMTPEIQGKIFSEFFTTKPPERGTGLGLVMVKRIVESVGGKITFHSSPGQGSTFVVTLPLVLKAPEQPQERMASSVA